MKVKRMGLTEILRRIWLFSANKIKSSESVSKQPTQLIVELNSSLRHIIVIHIGQIFAKKKRATKIFQTQIIFALKQTRNLVIRTEIRQILDVHSSCIQVIACQKVRFFH